MNRLRRAARRLAERAETRLHGLSLRARLISVVVALLVLALLTVGALTLAVLQRVLVGQVDSDLRTVANSSATQHAFGGSYGSSQHMLPSDYVVRYYDPSGARQPGPGLPPNFSSADLDFGSMTWTHVIERGGRGYTIHDRRTGEPWRVVVYPVRTQSGDTFTLGVARPLDGVDRSLQKVAVRLLLLGVAVVVAGALLGVAAIRRAFSPLRQVEAVAGAFRDGDTSHRVAVTAPGTEVGRLGSAVNAMLDRIGTSLAAREASEARMRQFVADASHELRTPLAAVRGYAELHRLGAIRSPDEVSGAFGRIETEATRLGRLVEDLLTLARLDEARPLRTDPVDLLPLAADAVTDAHALAPERTITLVGLPVQLGGPGGRPTSAPVTGDESALRQVVSNLVANAVRHTPAGTPLQLAVGTSTSTSSGARWARLAVVDHGPGIPEADAPRVFERFWRADPSRQRAALASAPGAPGAGAPGSTSGTGGGSGLGMAIVASILAAHHGLIRVTTTPGGGATFDIALPLSARGHGEPLDDTDDDGYDEPFDDEDDDTEGTDGAVHGEVRALRALDAGPAER